MLGTFLLLSVSTLCTVGRQISGHFVFVVVCMSEGEAVPAPSARKPRMLPTVA